MSAQTFTPEFKEEAVKQVPEKGLSVKAALSMFLVQMLCMDPAQRAV